MMPRAQIRQAHERGPVAAWEGTSPGESDVVLALGAYHVEGAVLGVALVAPGHKLQPVSGNFVVKVTAAYRVSFAAGHSFLFKEG